MKSEWLEGNMENGAVINNRKFQCREKFQWKNRHQRTKRMMEKKSNPEKPWKSGLQVVWVFTKKTHKRIRRPNASSQTSSQSKWRLTQDEQQRMTLQAGMNTKRQEQKKQYQKLPVVIKVVQKKNPCFTLFFKSQHIIISQLDPSMQCKICAFERQIGPAKDTEVNTFVLQ